MAEDGSVGVSMRGGRIGNVQSCRRGQRNSLLRWPGNGGGGLAAEFRKVRCVVVLTMLGCLLLCNGEEVGGGAVGKGAMNELTAML